MKKFDEILADVGDFGTYQKKIVFWMTLCQMVSSLNFMMSVISLGLPKFRCAIPGYSNDTFDIQNDYHQNLVNTTIPPSTEESLEYSQCFLFHRNAKEQNATLKPCSSYVYDTSVFYSTFATEQNLVCGEYWKRSLAKMIFFAGVFVGSFVLGSLSDIVGRKKTLCISLSLLTTSSFVISWSTDYLMFTILMFVTGVFLGGMITASFTLCTESVGPQKRVLAGMVILFGFALGTMYMAGVGYALRHWKYVAIACYAPTLLLISYWVIIPESARWLISQGKMKEANDIIRNIAKVNKVETTSFADQISEDKQKQGRFWQLFSTRTLFIRSVIVFFNWMVVCMTYYGLSLNTGNLVGNFYLNFFLTGLVEIPAYILLIVILDKSGRLRFYCLSMLIGGTACICTIFTTLYAGQSLQPITVTLAMLGKMFVTIAFNCLYVWTAELYPTVVRNAAVGVGSACARVGGMVSPYIADISTYVAGNPGRAAPMAVFGVLGVLAGLMALHLPETLNVVLQDHFQENEDRVNSTKVNMIEHEMDFMGNTEQEDLGLMKKV